MNELHLFAGAGGGILAGQLLGRRCVCAVEWDAAARSMLVARQNDGTFPPFPVWDDVRTFDGHPWRGVVDVVAGGFPCQDVSIANTHRKADEGDGLDGERSGLWSEFKRIVREVRPRRVEVENSPRLLVLGRAGLSRILGDLAELGFDARWGVLGSCDVGGGHGRKRLWISAHASLTRKSGRDRTRDRLDHYVMALDGGPLNPEYPESLMSWPIGLSAFEPLATDRIRLWRLQHGACSAVSESEKNS